MEKGGKGGGGEEVSWRVGEVEKSIGDTEENATYQGRG